MASSYTTYTIPNLKQVAFDYAFAYCKEIADAKFQTPSDFLGLVDMFYESLIKDDEDEPE